MSGKAGIYRMVSVVLVYVYPLEWQIEKENVEQCTQGSVWATQANEICLLTTYNFFALSWNSIED